MKNTNSYLKRYHTLLGMPARSANLKSRNEGTKGNLQTTLMHNNDQLRTKAHMVPSKTPSEKKLPRRFGYGKCYPGAYTANTSQGQRSGKFYSIQAGRLLTFAGENRGLNDVCVSPIEKNKSFLESRDESLACLVGILENKTGSMTVRY